MMKTLTKEQVRALKWLAKNGSWTAAWWFGRQHGRWPNAMSVEIINSLLLPGLIEIEAREWAHKTVSITDNGRAALAES
jgi:hypothetical protein